MRFSAQTTLYFTVYPCVAAPFARVSKTGYFPVLHISADYLGIASENVEWNFCLGSKVQDYKYFWNICYKK